MTTPTNSSKDTKSRFHIVLAHLLGAPGYIIWITGWLFLVAMGLSAFAPRGSVIPVSTDSSGLDILVNPQPLSALQGLVSMAIILGVWYIIAAVVRKCVWYLCKKRPSPEHAWLVLMLGGLVVSWLGVGVLLYLTGITWQDLGALLSLPIFAGIISLCLEAALVNHWKLEV